MNSSFVKRIAAELEEIKAAGLFKTERIIASAQGAEILVNGREWCVVKPRLTLEALIALERVPGWLEH